MPDMFEHMPDEPTPQETDMEGEGGPDPSAKERPAAPAWSPSEHEFRALMDGQRQLQEQFTKLQEDLYEDEPEETPPDFQGLSFKDMPPEQVVEVMEAVASKQFEKISPALEAFSREQGQRQMDTMLTQIDPSGEAFDRKLAGQLADQAWNESGQQLDPQQAVRIGAQRAREIREAERGAAAPRHVEPDDLPITGGAQAGRKKFKDYDEVADFHRSLAEDTSEG